MPDLPTLLTAAQIADQLGLTEDYILRQAASGNLPSYKIGGYRRFDASEVMDWLAGKAEGERVPLAEVRTLREAG